jgi:hypothetical protein
MHTSRNQARRRVRTLTAAFVVTAAVAGPEMPPGHAQVPRPPEVAGLWTAPFEEGGAETPRCHTDGEGRILCKPIGQGMAMLPDGRLFYWNGNESQENINTGALLSMAPESRDSRARLLDLRSGTPRWQVPEPETGVGANPNITPGHRTEDDVLGAAGVPGRPGDGLVGSTWGQLGGPPHNPTSSPDDVQNNDGDLFCTDVTLLHDGRLLVAGGTDWYNEPSVLERDKGDPEDVGVIELEGLRSSQVFDPATNAFQPLPPMKYGRWYPTMVTLGDGRVQIFSGTTKLIKTTQGGQVRRTEEFDPERGTWEEQYVGPQSETELPELPRLNLLPNGTVLYNGVGGMSFIYGTSVDAAVMALTQVWHPEKKTWETVGPAPFGARSGASSVMLRLEPPYDDATLVDFGGTLLLPNPGSEIAVPLTTLTTVDRAGKVGHRLAGNLHHGRWFASGILLPDGTVAAVGGADKDHLNAPGTDRGVHQLELFDPRTGRWTEMAGQARDRSYHQAAMLLPDMRILSGGHGPIGRFYGTQRDNDLPGHANNDKDPSFEVWSPPYLFRGPRPVISHAPAGVRWGERFTVTTPQADEIAEVVLIQVPSPQHVIDSDQRAVSLEFTRTGPDSLSVAAPAEGNIAPRGYYYLVVNRKSPRGLIPSVARIVQVGPTSDPNEAPQPFPDDAPAPTGGSATDVNAPSTPPERRFRPGVKRISYRTATARRGPNG